MTEPYQASYGQPAAPQPPYGQQYPPAHPGHALLPKGGKAALIFGIVLLFLGALAGLVVLVFPAPFMRVFGSPAELFEYMHHWAVMLFTFVPLLLRTALYGVIGLFLAMKSRTWAGGPFPGILLSAFALIGLFAGRFFAFIPSIVMARYGAPLLAAYSILSNSVSVFSGTLQTVGALLIFGCCCCAMGRARP